MSTRGVQHRRAARAMIRRQTDHVQLLEERFSPTAIFPGMTIDNPFTRFFPDDDEDPRPGHGPRTRTTALPEITIISPPVVPPETTTSIVVVLPPPPTTTSSLPIILTTSSALTPTSTSTSTSTSSSSIITSTSSTTRPVVFSSSTSSLPTVTVDRANASTSSSPSPSSESQTQSQVNGGAVAGGIIAGIIAAAAIAFAVVFYRRRKRRQQSDATASFDARDFRRSAVMLQDPPTHEDTIARGYNPPPPPMMEQSQSPVATSAWGYGNAAGIGMQTNQPYYPSFVPGQVAAAYISAPSPSAYPSAPSPVAYTSHNPISPVSSHGTPGIVTVLTRKGSNNSSQEQRVPVEHMEIAVQVATPVLVRQSTTRSAQIPTDDYVDLDRSSISPFQAAQYAEISRRLAVAPPIGSTSPTSPAQLYATQQKDLPPPPEEVGSVQEVQESTSPFADPTSVPVSPQSRSPNYPVPTVPTLQTLHVPAYSADSFTQEELEFPVPPSPALSYSSRYRVDSLPPTLPEIKLQERSSISSYTTNGMPSGLSDLSTVDGMGSLQVTPKRFVNTPSPLASSFGMISPNDRVQEESRFTQAQAEVLGSQGKDKTATTTPANTSTPIANSKSDDNKRPATVYDLEDAYGGF